MENHRIHLYISVMLTRLPCYWKGRTLYQEAKITLLFVRQIMANL